MQTVFLGDEIRQKNDIYAVANSYQCLHCPLTKLTNTANCIGDYRRYGPDFMGTRADLFDAFTRDKSRFLKLGIILINRKYKLRRAKIWFCFSAERRFGMHMIHKRMTWNIKLNNWECRLLLCDWRFKGQNLEKDICAEPANVLRAIWLSRLGVAQTIYICSANSPCSADRGGSRAGSDPLWLKS